MSTKKNIAFLFVLTLSHNLLTGCAPTALALATGAMQGLAGVSSTRSPKYGPTSTENDYERERMERENQRMRQQICDQAMDAYSDCMYRNRSRGARGDSHRELCAYPVMEC